MTKIGKFLPCQQLYYLIFYLSTEKKLFNLPNSAKIPWRNADNSSIFLQKLMWITVCYLLAMSLQMSLEMYQRNTKVLGKGSPNNTAHLGPTFHAT